jgi:hypothetical protein
LHKEARASRILKSTSFAAARLTLSFVGFSTPRRECAPQDLTVIVEFAKLVTLKSLQRNERWRRRAI